jgi:hypothetical protein
MPAISLVVCLRGESDLLARLLEKAAGCYDDLVVVHDGPEVEVTSASDEAARWNVPPAILAKDFSISPESEPMPEGYCEPSRSEQLAPVRTVVHAAGGRFFEGPRVYQQEPHWPFAWSRAAHDWILRLDADEFPSPDLREWLIEFRRSPDSKSAAAIYTAVWPLWDGSTSVTRRWPNDRIFLFDRTRVRFFGMVEQVPMSDAGVEATDLVLEHRPRRKSYGAANLVLRKQAYRWRAVIARSLLGPVDALPRWQWSEPSWPAWWEALRKHPVSTGIKRALRGLLGQAKEMSVYERRLVPDALLGTALHPLLIAVTYCYYRRLRRDTQRL